MPLFGVRPSDVRAARPWRRGALIALGLLVFTFWPLLLALLAGGVAGAANCALDESGAHPCLIAGHDVGEALASLAVVGWLALVTVPLGLALSALVALTALLRVFWHKRRR